MTTEHAGGRRSAPVRISHMKIAPADPRQPADAPLVIEAEFDPGPGGEEHLWWIEQLQGRVKVLGGTGSPRGGMTAIRVEAPRDQVEAVARRLLTAVEEVNAAYPEGYTAWRREQDERMAGQLLQEQRRAAAPQAILDRVMDEYRSGQ